MTTSKANQPNIILVNCDDLGYGDLGCYGSNRNSTPAIDQLAAEGMRFTDFYMASPVCTPSRGALLTGCYPPRISFGAFGPDNRWVLVPGYAEGLNPDEMTLAKLLKGQGYRTMCVGKWHCGDQPEFLPTRHGFDGYYGIPYSNDMGRQIGRGNRGFPPLPLMDNETVLQEQPDQAGITERYVEQSVRFIRQNRDKPFFLYLAHMYVHLPLIVPAIFEKRSRNGRYGAAVECIDWAMSVLIHELEALGLDGNTMVLFTSDNGSRGRDGGGSNAPLRGFKGTCWEGGMRLPLIVRWPGHIRAGSVCQQIAASIDLLPTFAALTGATLPDDRIIDGRDISPLLLGRPCDPPPRQTFFYYLRNDLHAVRHGDWKLHVRRDGQNVRELYNLRDDVAESNNVADANPKIVGNLQALLQACREDLGDTATGTVGANVRPCGVASHPVTLTRFDPSHPYVTAEYDLSEFG